MIPVYNEEESIGQVIEDINKAIQVHAIDDEILVVDDCSIDSTASVTESKGIKVIRHARNRGLGAARTTGMLHSKGEIIVMIDVDSSYPAESIPGFVNALEGCDMVIGARIKEEGSWKYLRWFVKTVIKTLACCLTRTNIPDINSGLRAMRKSVVLKYKKYLPTIHSWVSSITLIMLYNGYKVKFLPIKYFKRKGFSTFIL